MVPERPRSRLIWALALLGLARCHAAEPDRARGPRDGQIDFSCSVAEVPSALRRLTRFEYAAAVEDVFGITVDVEVDNHAASLGTNDRHVEALLMLAEEVSARIAGNPAGVFALGNCDGPSLRCAQTFANTLGSRLFRRPITEAELSRLTAMFSGDFSEQGLRQGAELVIAALLQSPSFLYRLDYAAVAHGPAGERPLAAPEILASRLSFLFWNSVPDRELALAAASGRLANASDVKREARRLWSDARTRRSLWHFHSQWLGLADFGSTEKNLRLFEFWNQELRRDLLLETRHFVNAIAWEEDRRFATLLTAPYTFANPRLQEFYGLASASGEERFTRVSFPASAPRAGLLTHGSVLSVHASVEQTSPVARGKFIRERFFCATPPPPPPNIAVSLPALDPRLTTRQRFERHTADTACAGCHRLLDPIGFGFERYDASGHYRATEAGAPIDATGFLAGTDVDGAFDGAIELSQRLAASEDVRRCFVSHWFRYAFGREAAPEEACSLERLARVFRESDGDLEELVVGLTQLEAFLSPSGGVGPG
jgi:Arc/MetJ-type ribon-helix-helix transcriptional regulator